MRKALYTLASIFLALILFAWCTLPAQGTQLCTVFSALSIARFSGSIQA